MKRPPFLKSGDKIGLVSPAKSIQPEQVKAAVRVLQRWGLEPVFGRHLFANYHQFAGKDADRAADIQEFLDDNSIKAILASRGGYGSNRIIDQLDFSNFKKNPKWVIGYSDITVFHSHIHQQFMVETLHATMPLNFPDDFSEDNSINTLKKALFGNLNEYKIGQCKVLRGGQAIAPLVGGNLSIINSLIGTPSELNTNGKILLIEDVGENLFRIDRMIQQMKRAGKLKNLKALLIGGFTNMEDNKIPYGQSAEEIIFEACKEYNYPVFSNIPVGHQQDNFAMYFGNEVEVLMVAHQLYLKFL